MKTLLTNSLLLGVALTLLVLFALPALGATAIYCALRIVRPRELRDYVSEAALSLALSLDLLGNVWCKALLNATMRKPGGYGFGQYNQTISAVLGHNKQLGTLTWLGRVVASLLNRIDADHVERAARN